MPFSWALDQVARSLWPAPVLDVAGPAVRANNIELRAKILKRRICRLLAYLRFAAKR